MIISCSNDPDPILPPALTTLPVSDITQTSAKSGGNITDDGGGEITARGIVWSTDANPSINDHAGMTQEGTGSGEFHSMLTELLSATEYYVRSYATNSAGTAYGNEIKFETVEPAYLLTLEVNHEEGGTVTGSGEYQEGEEINITATANEGWEFVNWSGDTDHVDDTSSASTTVTMPADDINLTANFQEVADKYMLTLKVGPAHGGTVNGSGEYEEGSQINITAIANDGMEFINWTGDIEHLDNIDSVTATVTMPADDIILKANFEQVGLVYGNGVTDIDGNEYITVIIGEQEWMAENLRVTHYNNGEPIPINLHNDNDEDKFQIGSYTIYPHELVSGINSNEEMFMSYGLLYNWYAVAVESMCPSGWRVPCHLDWTTLEQFVCYLMGYTGCYETFPYDFETKGFRGQTESNALKSCRQVNSPLGGYCDTDVHPRWGSDWSNFGLNLIGYSALPAGYRMSGGYAANIGFRSYFWTSSMYSDSYAWHRHLSRTGGSINRYNARTTNHYSVRCVRDID